MIEASKDSVPPFLMPFLEKLAPLVAQGWNLIDVVGPQLHLVYVRIMHVWALAKPYHPEEFLPIAFGFVMCFFGGSFMLLIAAVEAFRMTGYEKTRASLQILIDDYNAVAAASHADDQLDENNDGVADVKQISKKQLFSRKVALVLRTLDPIQCMAALNGVLAGFMAVVATLKLRLAKSITLGSSIGSILASFADRHVSPSLRAVLPADYHKWISPAISYTCQTCGVCVAYTVEQVLSAWHSSIRGGQQLAVGLLHFATRNGYAAPAALAEGSPAFTGLEFALAGLGFYFQMSYWTGMPFPFNLLLLPFRLCEYFLAWAVYLHS